MKTRQTVIFASALFAAAVVYTLALYPQLPDLIPIHWNLHGQIDGWAEKRWAVWLMPAIMLVLTGMQMGLPFTASAGFRVKPFRKTYDYLLLVCTALMGYIHVIMLQAALHPGLDFGRSLIVGLFLFLALMGNVMGRTRRNPWIGIRTPWTLASEEVWIATHRMAGYFMTGAGILGAVALWFGAPIMVCFAFLMVALLLPTAYSFVLFNRLGGSAD